MKKIALVVGLVGAAAAVWAVDVLPHTFTPGTAIKSAEVNANFQTLRASAVAQDARLMRVESSLAVVPADQLICVLFSTWATGGTSFPCLQASSHSAVRSLTMEQVLGEGWISVAAGGGDNGNRIVMTFRR
jgi:hypothetical protein